MGGTTEDERRAVRAGELGCGDAVGRNLRELITAEPESGISMIDRSRTRTRQPGGASGSAAWRYRPRPAASSNAGRHTSRPVTARNA